MTRQPVPATLHPTLTRRADLWVIPGQRLAAVGPQSGSCLYVAPVVLGV